MKKIKVTPELLESNRIWKKERKETSKRIHKMKFDHFYICHNCDEDWESTHRTKKCPFCKSKDIERTNIMDD